MASRLLWVRSRQRRTSNCGHAGYGHWNLVWYVRGGFSFIHHLTCLPGLTYIYPFSSYSPQLMIQPSVISRTNQDEYHTHACMYIRYSQELSFDAMITGSLCRCSVDIHFCYSVERTVLPPLLPPSKVS